MNVRWLILGLCLGAGLAHAERPGKKPSKGEPTIRYRPPLDSPEDRPVATEISAAPQGSGYALRITFNRPPWGDQCKNRCANTTVFLDTDDDRTTGMRLGAGALETGADLAITVQGVREYKEKSAESLLRARVRHLPDGSTGLEGGTVLAEMDHQHDPDKIQLDGNHVFILVDATNISIPSGRTMRVIYHPPVDKARDVAARGILSSGGSPAINPFERSTKRPPR